MNISSLRKTFLLSIIVGVSILLFFILQPFLIPLALAAVFAVVLKPVHGFFLRHMKRWPSFAALATMLFGVLCVVVPMFLIGFQIAGNAQTLFETLSQGGTNYIRSVVSDILQLLTNVFPSIGNYSSSILASIDENVKTFLSWIVSNLGAVFSGVTHMLFALFIFMIALFYLLVDGDRLRKVLITLSPLSDVEDVMVLHRLEIAVNSVVKGSLIVAATQGVVSGIGLSLFGVPNPVLWGVVAGFAALIPTLGTSLVLIPAALFLLTKGAFVAAIGLFIWALFAVGLIDNFLSPRLVGKGAQLHPLLVLLSVLGGISLFGPAGLILGPLCSSLLLALLSIYLDSVKKV